MVLHLVRIVFLLVVLAVTVSFSLQAEVYQEGAEYVTWYMLLPAGFAVILILVDMMWHRKRLQLLSGLFFGALAGLVFAYALSLIVSMIVALFPTPPPAPHPGAEPVPPVLSADPTPEERTAHETAKQEYLRLKDAHDRAERSYMAYSRHVQTVQLVKLLLGVAAVFLCVSFVLQTKDDFRFVIPYVEFARQRKGPRPMLLDTSAIIDGRIADITETRILESELIVPRFILAELQAIADSDDKLRRNRGRRGLDVLNRLRTSDKVDIRIVDTTTQAVEEADEVDAKLVALAGHLDGRIITNDYNLNKIAQLHEVVVININDLANSLKPIVLPGETMHVKVIKPGEEAGQGVGYLEDGTMVVAERGREHIGQEIAITVTSVLQTSAGRMIFGKSEGPPPRRERKG